MLIKKPVVEFRPILLFTLLVMILRSDLSLADVSFRLEKDSKGLIRPFKALSVPLPDFVREYQRVTSTPILVGGNWEQELKGSVTLFLRHALQLEEMTEVFYRVLGDNGYAVIDAPAGNGWILERTREARDAALPVYEISEVPNSNRLVTAYHELKYANAESVARMIRSFMPANSRIIPATFSKLFITDTATNIRKLKEVISRMDTQQSASKSREMPPSYFGPPRTCGEQRIEKLVVEKLEIQDGGSALTGAPSPQMKVMKEGNKK